MSGWRPAPAESELGDYQYYWFKPCKEDWIEGFSSAQIVFVYKAKEARDRMLYGNYMVKGGHWGSPSPLSAFSKHLWCGPIQVPEGGDRA